LNRQVLHFGLTAAAVALAIPLFLLGIAYAGWVLLAIGLLFLLVIPLSIVFWVGIILIVTSFFLKNKGGGGRR
jgi:hypothetical protein